MPPPEPISDSKVSRDFKIFRKDIIDREAKHGDGFTPNCPGCLAARRNAIPKNHSPTCRARYKSILLQTEIAKLRVESAQKRRENPRSVRQSQAVDPDRSSAPSSKDSSKIIMRPAEFKYILGFMGWKVICQNDSPISTGTPWF